jgi:hypothetical protein
MLNIADFPKQVRVRVDGPFAEGVAVGIRFEMRRKNDFNYTVFLDETGAADVSAAELLKTFDEDRAAFLMDYVDPRTNFTGQVKARVLTDAELRRAVGALEMFRGKIPFPDGYEERLRAAVARGQDSKQYSVEVVVE